MFSCSCLTLLIPIIAIGLGFYNQDLVITFTNNLVKETNNYFKVNILSETIKDDSKTLVKEDEKIKKRCEIDGKLLTKEELAKYDGSDSDKPLYLAFLGNVFDVTKGEKHYGLGQSYSMFTGKDASRAYITGDFRPEGLIDNLNDLSPENFSGIQEWLDFYEKTYKKIGRVIGSFYDSNGCETDQAKNVRELIKHSEQLKHENEYDNQIFPLCNTEWSSERKETKYWCSDQSGGFKRDWVGVPRKLILKDENDYRCACVKNSGPKTDNAVEYYDENEDVAQKNNDNGDLNNPRIREFENCNPKHFECIVKNV